MKFPSMVKSPKKKKKTKKKKKEGKFKSHIAEQIAKVSVTGQFYRTKSGKLTN